MKHNVLAIWTCRLGRSLEGDAQDYTRGVLRKVRKYVTAKWPEVDLMITESMTDLGSISYMSKHESVEGFWKWNWEANADDGFKRIWQEIQEKQKEFKVFLTENDKCDFRWIYHD